MPKIVLLFPLVLLAAAVLILWNPWRSSEDFKPIQSPKGTQEAGSTPRPVAPPPRPDPLYTFAKPTRGGTGKFYLGREISQVMGHQAIRWLERGNREDEESPSRAVAAIDLPRDAVIADIGAGSGYYTFRLALQVVPDGEVVAVDIQPEMLAHLKAKAKREGIPNVRTHAGTVESIGLAPASIDAALFVDAYHEFSHPREMMESVFRALRPGGRVFLLEFRAEDPKVPIKRLHKMSEVQARKEMDSVGLQWSATHSFLPRQHFMIFRKPM